MAESDIKKTKIFMCPPDFYGVRYVINPWMCLERDSEHKKAIDQWNKLYNLLVNELNVDVKLAEPRPTVPDMVFTANAALFHKDIALISRFRFLERQPEEKFFADWFKENDYRVEFLPEGFDFEGAGDALFSGDTLYAGYIPRTDISSHSFISELFNIRVISLELSDKRFYHLDTCFCPLENGYLMYFPDAFDEYGNQVIEANFPEEKRIVVNEEEAFKFSCNAVNVGKAVVMNNTTRKLKEELLRKGFFPYELDLSEFMKTAF